MDLKLNSKYSLRITNARGQYGQEDQTTYISSDVEPIRISTVIKGGIEIIFWFIVQDTKLIIVKECKSNGVSRFEAISPNISDDKIEPWVEYVAASYLHIQHLGKTSYIRRMGDNDTIDQYRFSIAAISGKIFILKSVSRHGYNGGNMKRMNEYFETYEISCIKEFNISSTLDKFCITDMENYIIN
jgi:hypothetical protein